jgi:hypothetical protein
MTRWRNMQIATLYHHTSPNDCNDNFHEGVDMLEEGTIMVFEDDHTSLTMLAGTVANNCRMNWSG